MKSFMEVCQNWGAEGCHPDISKWHTIGESDYHEGIQLHSAREETDDICRNCKALSFTECPDCGSKNIVEMTGFNPKKRTRPTHTCKNCNFSFTQARTI